MAAKTLTQHLFPVTVLEPDADRWNSDPASDVVNLSNYGGVTFLVAEGAGHGRAFNTDPTLYLDTVFNFLDAAFQKSQEVY